MHEGDFPLDVFGLTPLQRHVFFTEPLTCRAAPCWPVRSERDRACEEKKRDGRKSFHDQLPPKSRRQITGRWDIVSRHAQRVCRQNYPNPKTPVPDQSQELMAAGPGGASCASVASVVCRGHDQTRKKRACLAQRCAG